MELTAFLRAVLALVFTLALIGLAAYAAKRLFGGTFLSLSALPKGKKARLAVLEARPLDPRHTLFLIQRDGVQHVLLCSSHSAPVVVESSISPSDPLPEPASEKLENVAVPLGPAGTPTGRLFL